MVVLKLGLYLAAAAWAWVSWASWSAGYPQEVALLRGMVAFGAVSLLAYAGELVVATAPKTRQDGSIGGSEPPEEGPADDLEEDAVTDELPQAA